MNATQLLAYFDRLADAPDAVPRLQMQLLTETAVSCRLANT